MASRHQYSMAKHHASDLAHHCAAVTYCDAASVPLIGGWADEAFRKLAAELGYDVTPRAVEAPAIAAE